MASPHSYRYLMIARKSPPTVFKIVIDDIFLYHLQPLDIWLWYFSSLSNHNRAVAKPSQGLKGIFPGKDSTVETFQLLSPFIALYDFTAL